MPPRSCFWPRLSLAVVVIFAALSLPPPAFAARTEAFTPRERAQGFRDGVLLAKPRAAHRATVDRDEARERVRVRERFARFGDLRVVELEGGDSVASALARLRATGRYEFVEPDYLMTYDAVPNDPRFPSQWSLDNTGQVSGGTPGVDIKARQAWDVINSAPGVIVAVVDTGLNRNHEDIAANLWVNPAPTIGDVNGIRIIGGVRSGDLTDDIGHGSHVAGIIGAAGNNAVGIAGIAWRVQLMILKNGSGTSSTSDSAACIDYAIANGAKVINCSFGGTGESQTFFTALRAARNAGVVVVVSAGNSGENNDVSPHFPSNYLLDNIVAVGNSTAADVPSTSSDFGSLVELFAPGTAIWSLDPTSTSGYISRSGTSMAAPHVTGAMALLKARFPTDTHRQLINRLLRSVDRAPAFSGRALSGGRLNLLNAVNSTDARPFNDDFASAATMTGASATARGNTTGATTEPGEPAHAGAASTHTLWWQWTPPWTGSAIIDTAGSDFDTVLAVYTGSALSALTPLATNDNDAALLTSRVRFPVQAGTSYRIAVSGKGATGFALLNAGVTPVNDAFASAIALPALMSTRATGTTLRATAEPGEPVTAGAAGAGSVWYRWTAPASGSVQVSAFSTAFDTLLGVYTGPSVDQLTLVAGNDDTGFDFGSTTLNISNSDSRCTVAAVAGTTYYFQVGVKNGTTGGNFTLTLTDSLWQFSAGGTVTASPAIATDGTIYFGGGTPDRKFYAINPDGTLKWPYAAAGTIDNCSPAIGADGTVYFGSSDGRVTALTPAGGVRWQRALSAGSTANSPALAVDGTIYLHANGDGFLYALNPADGSTRWRYNCNVRTFASAAVGSDGTIYQPSDDRSLYALNPDGTLKWRFTTDGDTFSTPAIDAAGNVYITTYTGAKLLCVTPAGTLRWSYTATTGALLSSSATLSADGSTAYLGDTARVFHAVNTADGTVRWKLTLGESVLSSTAAIDATGVIYVGAYDGKLYAINSNGTVKRTWDTAGFVRSSPAIFGRTLYVGSNDGKLYAFDIGATAAPGPWPMYRHNVRRNGRALIDPLAITAQPIAQAARVGDPVSLNVVATGQSPLSFQWSKDGTPIAGATGTTLQIDRFAAANAGSYRVTVTGPQGSVTSAAAALTLDPMTVRIFALSAARSVSAGTEVTLSVTANGLGALSYQWQRNGEPIPGATTATLPLGRVVPEMAGAYTVVIADGTTTVTSASSALAVTGETPFLVSTVAGALRVAGTTDGPGAEARFTAPSDLVVDAAGYLYVSDRAAHTIRKISPTGVVTTLAGRAGTAGATDGPAASALFNAPAGLVLDRLGNLFVADSNNHRIRKITPAGVVSILAGQLPGNVDGTGSAARFQSPISLAIDAAGNLYCAESTGHTIRKITPAGVVTTVAGLTRVSGGTDGPGADARFNNPGGLAIDAAGNLYVADTGNHTIRRITPAGEVTTVAGQAGASGTTDGPGASARFTSPSRIVIDAGGDFLVTSTTTIRRITPAGMVTTALGTAGASAHVDGLGGVARFALMTGLAVDEQSSLYIADTTNLLLRKASLIGRRGARLANLSVRSMAGTGGDTFIVGFSLAAGTRPLLIRAVGPSLAAFGVTGALPDPALRLDGANAMVAQNDDWSGGGDAIGVAAAATGAFPLPTQSKDAALLQSLAPGTYTAQVGGGAGVALVEVYDAGNPTVALPVLPGAAPRLVNVSARTRAGTGADTLIVGFVIAGDTAKGVLIRGIGPTLAAFGVESALANPRLELYRGALLVAENSAWGGSPALTAAFGQVGAFPLAADSKDAALLVTLLPGAYTAQITGAAGASGVALVEIYEMP